MADSGPKPSFVEVADIKMLRCEEDVDPTNDSFETLCQLVNSMSAPITINPGLVLTPRSSIAEIQAYLKARKEGDAEAVALYEAARTNSTWASARFFEYAEEIQRLNPTIIFQDLEAPLTVADALTLLFSSGLSGVGMPSLGRLYTIQLKRKLLE